MENNNNEIKEKQIFKFKEINLIIDYYKNDNSKISSLITNSYENLEEKKSNFWKILLGIIIGQLLSILSVLNGFFSERTEKKKEIIIPFLLTSGYYILLFLCFLTYNKFTFKKPKLCYIIIILIDSITNAINTYVFSISKFEYPYIINLNSSIWSVIFTIIIIKIYKYCQNHILGLIIAFIGNVLSFIGTFNSFQDILKLFKEKNYCSIIYCFIISILYSLDQVLQERYLSEYNEIFDYFVWYGILGFFISILFSFLFGEVNYFYNCNFDCEFFIYFCCFSLTLTIFTSISLFYINKFSANMFSLNLVSTVFWSFIINGIFITGNVHYNFMIIFFIVGLIFIIIGTSIFNYQDRKCIIE